MIKGCAIMRMGTWAGKGLWGAISTNTLVAEDRQQLLATRLACASSNSIYRNRIHSHRIGSGWFMRQGWLAGGCLLGSRRRCTKLAAIRSTHALPVTGWTPEQNLERAPTRVLRSCGKPKTKLKDCVNRRCARCALSLQVHLHYSVLSTAPTAFGAVELVELSTSRLRRAKLLWLLARSAGVQLTRRSRTSPD